MKKYVKPQMIIEEFRADESICTCTGTESIRRGYDIIGWNTWREWNDGTNGNPKDGHYQAGEEGNSFNPGDYVNSSIEKPFVITSGQDSGKYGTIIDVKRGLAVWVTYRNAS